MKTMAEEWRSIPGAHPYEVSNSGEVRRARPSGSAGVALKPSTASTGGYVKYSLSIEGKVRTMRGHVIVALAFFGPRPEGAHVRHLNGKRTDNRVTNLAYGSHSENERDKIVHGTHHHAKKTHCKHGHEFTAANTYRDPGTNERVCRTCKKARRPRARAAALEVS